MRKLHFIWISLLLCGLLSGIARAETFQLTDGETVSGEIVSHNEDGLVLRLPDNRYSERIPWSKFNQADLRKLAENPKIAPLAEPFIEVTEAERAQATAVDLKPVPRLQKPAPQSILGALFASPVGLLLVLIVYAANIYAGYEIAMFRARPKILVCGAAALAPILAPIVFLAMPTKIDRPEDEGVLTESADAGPIFSVQSSAPSASATAHASEASMPSSSSAHTAQGAPLPPSQSYQRGAFTFNRRFIETKFAGFFGVVKRDVDKDMVLFIRAARGRYVAERITRITTNDMHVEVRKGPASEEVMIPFSEIQEIQLKHKDA